MITLTSIDPLDDSNYEKGFFRDSFFWDWLPLWLALGKSSNPNCFSPNDNLFYCWLIIFIYLLPDWSLLLVLTATDCYWLLAENQFILCSFFSNLEFCLKKSENCELLVLLCTLPKSLKLKPDWLRLLG